MKRSIKNLLLASGVAAFLLLCAGLSFQEELARYARRSMDKSVASAIAKYGASLPDIDAVRLLRINTLEDAPANSRRYRFPRDMPYREAPEMAIVAEHSLSGEEAKAFADTWRHLHLHTGYMAGCFDPHHVIQFRKNRRTVCETITCFMCENTTLPAFPWTALVSFDALSKDAAPSYSKFRELVERHVGKHESNLAEPVSAHLRAPAPK